MIQQWNNLPISQKTYLQASILPPVFQASLQVEETRHRTIFHLISMLALCLFLPQSFLLLCIGLLAPCSLLLIYKCCHLDVERIALLGSVICLDIIMHHMSD